jgi:glycosyltransferase 2 family protein
VTSTSGTPAAGPRWRPILRALQLLLAVAFVWFAGRAIWQQLQDARGQVSFVPRRPVWLVAASALLVANYLVLVESWRRVLLAWGAHVPFGEASRVWFVSNLGKYVPGKVWQLSAMTLMLREHGISTLVAGAAAVVVTLGNVGAGFALAVGFGGARVLGQAYFATIVGLAVLGAALVLMPLLSPVVVHLLARWRGREYASLRVPATASLWAFAGCGLGWVMSGLAFRWFALGMVGDASRSPFLWIAAYSGSYLLGYIAVFAPGGFGVRELALATALPALGLASPADAAVLTLASRLWLTVLEVLPGVLYLWASRRRRG